MESNASQNEQSAIRERLPSSTLANGVSQRHEDGIAGDMGEKDMKRKRKTIGRTRDGAGEYSLEFGHFT